MKNKNHRIISVDAEKEIDAEKKTLQKVGIEGTYLNIIKAIYDRPTADIILNGGKMKVCRLRSRTGKGCPALPLSFNVVSEDRKSVV